LFDYGDNLKGKPIEYHVTQINPYLVDAPTLLIQKRSTPLSNDVPKMVYGNKPVDGGNLLLAPEEKQALLAIEPSAEKWLRPLLGSEEFINGKERWCLWLVGIAPSELSTMPEVLKRVAEVKISRLASVDPQARELAERPTQFRDIKEPATYILIPSVSSEERNFIPIGFFDSNTISTNANFMLPDAMLYHFGILNSTFHNAWTRAVCGRLESRYRYSNTIVYNNFVWPNPTSAQIKAIETKAQAVLDARAVHTSSTLADLYNPLTMPPNLTKAHKELDRAVDSAYGYKGKKEDADRVAFLFALYQKLTAPLVETEQPQKRPKKKSSSS
jgi:hypothetical protein